VCWPSSRASIRCSSIARAKEDTRDWAALALALSAEEKMSVEDPL